MEDLLKKLLAIKLDFCAEDISGFGAAKDVIETASNDDLKDCLVVLREELWEFNDRRRHTVPMQLFALILSVALAAVSIAGLGQSAQIITVAAACVVVYVVVVIGIDLHARRKLRPLRILVAMIERKLEL